MSFCEINLKVIPNASRDQIVGWYGDALKVKTKTQPEGGKANQPELCKRVFETERLDV